MAGKKIKVMIDAGHYAHYNRSPAVPEYWESLMTWSLHKKLIAGLEKYGIECGATRSDQEKDMEVYTRGRQAKGYDMFISLHSNAVGSAVNESVDRPVVYRLAADTGDGAVLASEIADMLHGLMGTSQPGRVATRLNSSGGEYYGVLRGAKAVGCPHAYIIEHSFHTATAPARWLLSEDNLQKIAAAEAKLIARFFGLDGENGSGAAESGETADLAARVGELEKRCRVYRTYDELPDYARPAVERLHKEGVFAGAGPGDMLLTADLMRMLVILANKGVI